MNLNAAHGIDGKKPNWAPLEQRIGEQCADFMWIYAKDGVEYYKHIVTRRYRLLELAGEASFSAFDGSSSPSSSTMGYAVATSA